MVSNATATKKIVVTAIVAATYWAVTMMIAPIGFLAVQFRISEIMVLLSVISPAYAPGLILGCALANLGSPLGPIDVVVGTFATFCAVTAMSRTKSLFLASLWPTIFNGILIAWELNLVTNAPFLETAMFIAIEEFVVVTGIGYPLFKALMKNDKIMEILTFKH